MIHAILAISAGAALGAVLRWLLGILLNQVFPLVPLGTLAANLLGGYCIGLALSLFAAHAELAPEWRLFIITGFLGALTTFSAFSAEVVALLQQQRLFWAMGVIALHVCGSLCMTFLGLASARFFSAFSQ
ncbi:MAG: fluoride efflux transporter CrcB [Deltaproteobacteria bacterium]|jgi:CrcB protein|nr:fluoride efflux transporter CrcB [Deltaproteobacteria bacterium]